MKFSIDDANNIAIGKGGLCLSTEYSYHKKLKWQCGTCGKTWDALFYSIKNGTWCPHCCNPYERRSMIKQVCKTCGQDFYTLFSKKEYCSRLCYRRQPEIKEKYYASTKKCNNTKNKSSKRRFSRIKSKSKSLGFTTDLTLEQVESLWSMGCTYCGQEITDCSGSGLDRLDNSMGYTVNNVVPCCGKCNQIKNIHLSHDEMKIAMTAILEYRKSNKVTPLTDSI